MFGTHDLWLFIISGLLLNITPGVDTLYIISRSSAQGFRAGFFAALGIGAGCMVHIFATTIGLSALLATSAMAFGIVKSIGACYLIYIGITMLRTTKTPLHVKVKSLHQTLKTIFWQGFLTNVLNPKVALFFLAFLPQFVDVEAANKAFSMLFLGIIFDINGTLWNIFVAWTAMTFTHKLQESSAFMLWFNRSIGVLFLSLGGKLLWEER
ncbi:MAG: LysE family translocator [Sulfurospirillaceae bacterium]|nr:LysE family translocator [Sulfurospirillaceae bacterium]